MDKYERIRAALEAMKTPDIIAIHNEYCINYHYIDDYIYSMDDFDDIVSGYTPYSLALCLFNGHHFNPADDYFFFNGYANLESINFYDDEYSPVYLDDLTDCIIRNDEDFNNEELRRILDEDEEEEDNE